MRLTHEEVLYLFVPVVKKLEMTKVIGIYWKTISKNILRLPLATVCVLFVQMSFMAKKIGK